MIALFKGDSAYIMERNGLYEVWLDNKPAALCEPLTAAIQLLITMTI